MHVNVGKIKYSLKFGGRSVKTGTYFVMYTITKVESIIDTQIVVIFDVEFGIIQKEESQRQLITVERERNHQ